MISIWFLSYSNSDLFLVILFFLILGTILVNRIVVIRKDLLDIYCHVSVQEKSLSHLAFYHALTDILESDEIISKQNSWYPSFISAVMFYKRAKLERKSLLFVNGHQVYSDCKSCDKVRKRIFISRTGSFRFVLMDVTLQQEGPEQPMISQAHQTLTFTPLIKRKLMFCSTKII